jgi:hypothetical protein
MMYAFIVTYRHTASHRVHSKLYIHTMLAQDLFECTVAQMRQQQIERRGLLVLCAVLTKNYNAV